MAEKVVKEKKVSKISKIRTRLAQGWKDVDKLAADTGAAVGTVKTQMYKYYKEQGIATPKRSKKQTE